MKKIVTLNVKQLRTEECFGYLKLVLAETENLPSEEPPSILTTSVNTYTDKFNGYDTALKASAVNPATVSVIRRFRHCIEGVCRESCHRFGDCD